MTAPHLPASSDMPSLEFTGRLVVITGVGRAGQVGEALAFAFAQRGARLALLDRDEAQVRARAADLVAQDFTATAHAANLADPADAERAAREVMAAHDTAAVHAVVCTAGGFGMTGPVSDADPEQWARQFTINLDTAFATTRAFLPALREGKGALVYFASVAALPQGHPKGMAAYAAAKSGVLALMRAVAADEKPHGVRANAVAPTAIRTATNLADMGDGTEYVERESVADVVAFLASPLARNVTGQVLALA